MSQEKHEFKAEIKKLLQILSKSLYQHKEIFIRELISNASDALKKIHYITLQNQDIESPNAELKIGIFFNAKNKTLTISDTGVGMNKDELVNFLGTIASSGSQKFLENLKASQEQEKEGKKAVDLDIIGQFGVGFYSVFMVAKSVKVVSKSYVKEQPAYSWESDGSGEFSLTPAEKKERGTDIIISLQDDETDFLTQYKLEEVVKKYSNFVSFPIFVVELKEGEGDVAPIPMIPTAEELAAKPEEEKIEEEKHEEKKEGEKKEEKVPPKPKPINEIEPLWKKNPLDVKPEQYKNFYNYVSHRYDNYSQVIHYNIDGQVQFHSILYIPESKWQDLMRPELEYGPDLYSKNVMIIQNCKELMPQWLRFIKGAVESEDVPLNISRDTIQNNRVIMKMEDLLVKKIINELKGLTDKDPEKYNKIWNQFGTFLKEGMVTDHARKDSLLPLLRFATSKVNEEELMGLDQYIKNMPADQKDIYYLVGDNLNTMRMSPHLGYYKEKGLDVILFHEPIDNFLMMNIHEYRVKGEGEKAEEKIYHFKAVDETEKTEESKKDEKKDEKTEEKKEEGPIVSEETKKFLEHIKSILSDKVMDVKASNKLYSNACRLANPGGGMSSSMQRAMRYWTQQDGKKGFEIPRKIFEINTEHPIIQGLQKIYNDSPTSGKIRIVIEQLFENCLLSEGDLPNPSMMVPRMNEIIEILITGKEPAPEPKKESKEEPKEEPKSEVKSDADSKPESEPKSDSK